MEEWEEVEIQAVSSGLEASPSELHAAFEISGDHLTEVRDRHTMMLVTSGEIPESHMADIAPERRLDWIVKELNGDLFSNGLNIPLHGATMDAIHLSKAELDGHSILKLQVGEFVRKLPIPAESGTIDASLSDGILNIKW